MYIVILLFGIQEIWIWFPAEGGVLLLEAGGEGNPLHLHHFRSGLAVGRNFPTWLVDAEASPKGESSLLPLLLFFVKLVLLIADDILLLSRFVPSV